MANPAPLLRGRTDHIYSRGVNRENISCEERNYRDVVRAYHPGTKDHREFVARYIAKRRLPDELAALYQQWEE